MMTISILAAAALAVLAPGQFNERSVIREQVKPNGQVQPALVAAAGWNTVHWFRWQMLVVEGGRQTSVKPDQVFPTGTAFKLRVVAGTDLFIYVLNFNSDGGPDPVLLFPGPNENPFLVRKDQDVKVPPDPPGGGGDQFRFTPPCGTENFYIIGSPKPLDWLRPAAGKWNKKQFDDLAQRAAANPLRGKSEKNVMDMIAKDSTLGKKDLELLPPPTDGGQVVLHASPNRDDQEPFLVHVELRHQP